MGRLYNLFRRAHLVDRQRHRRHNDDGQALSLIRQRLRDEALAAARRQGYERRIAVRQMERPIYGKLLRYGFEAAKAREPANQGIRMKGKAAGGRPVRCRLCQEHGFREHAIDIVGKLRDGMPPAVRSVPHKPIGIVLGNRNVIHADAPLQREEVAAQRQQEILPVVLPSVRRKALQKPLRRMEQKTFVRIRRSGKIQDRRIACPVQIPLDSFIKLRLVHRFSSPSKQKPRIQG